jgi:hypothetical protein
MQVSSRKKIAERKSNDCVDTPILPSHFKKNSTNFSEVNISSKSSEALKKPEAPPVVSTNKKTNPKENCIEDKKPLRYVDKTTPPPFVEKKPKEKIEQPKVFIKIALNNTSDSSKSSVIKPIAVPATTKQQQDCIDTGEQLIIQILQDLKALNAKNSLDKPGISKYQDKESKVAVAGKVASDLLVFQNSASSQSSSKQSPNSADKSKSESYSRHQSSEKGRIDKKPSSSEIESDKPRVRFCKQKNANCILNLPTTNIC